MTCCLFHQDGFVLPFCATTVRFQPSTHQSTFWPRCGTRMSISVPYRTACRSLFSGVVSAEACHDVSHTVSHGGKRCSIKAPVLPRWPDRKLKSKFDLHLWAQQFVMFWRGFSKQDIRVLLLRLRKGRLLLSQQDEKQKQKQTPKMEDRSGLVLLLALGTEPLLKSDTNGAKPALSQWAAKFNPAGQRFIWRDLLAGADWRRPASYIRRDEEGTGLHACPAPHER